MMTRLLLGLALLLVALSAACSLLPLRRLAGFITGSSYGNGSGEGDCANTGVYYPENPYTSWPIPDGDWSFVTATFCDPWYFQQFGTVHWGLDFGYPQGTPVVSAATAIVIRAEWGHPLRGNNIETCTGSNWCATYMHLEELFVIEGDTATVGLPLGTVGSTGNSTGPHLHFEVHDAEGVPVDPAPSLP